MEWDWVDRLRDAFMIDGAAPAGEDSASWQACEAVLRAALTAAPVCADERDRVEAAAEALNLAGLARVRCEELARAALAAADAVVARPTITHGRHCICSPCAAQDWSEPQLAPCGMHGSSCPPVYAPLGAAGDPVPAAADAVPAGAGEAEPQKWTGAEVLRSGRPVTEHEDGGS